MEKQQQQPQDYSVSSSAAAAMILIAAYRVDIPQAIVQRVLKRLEEEFIGEEWQLEYMDSQNWKEVGAPLGLVMAVRHCFMEVKTASMTSCPTNTTNTTGSFSSLVLELEQDEPLSSVPESITEDCHKHASEIPSLDDEEAVRAKIRAKFAAFDDSQDPAALPEEIVRARIRAKFAKERASSFATLPTSNTTDTTESGYLPPLGPPQPQEHQSASIQIVDPASLASLSESSSDYSLHKKRMQPRRRSIQNIRQSVTSVISLLSTGDLQSLYEEDEQREEGEPIPDDDGTKTFADDVATLDGVSVFI